MGLGINFKNDFKHNLIDLPKLKRIDGDIRLYETPDGNKYPSMTTILKNLDDGGIKNWEKSVGKKKAERVKKDASQRGDTLHEICEEYVLNKLDLSVYSARMKALFKFIQPELNNLDNVLATEATLYSDKYKVAGTLDFIGKYKGELAIVDFKGSTQPILLKTDYCRRKLFKYMVQCCGYKQMFYEMTGILVPNIVVLVSVQSLQKCQVFESKSNLFDNEFKICSDAYHIDGEIINESSFWKL